LCDEHRDAASSSANAFEEADKEHSQGGMVSKQMLQYLLLFNCGLFILVVMGGTMLVSNHPSLQYLHMQQPLQWHGILPDYDSAINAKPVLWQHCAVG
jgi:hypothetical protein